MSEEKAPKDEAEETTKTETKRNKDGFIPGQTLTEAEFQAYRAKQARKQKQAKK